MHVERFLQRGSARPESFEARVVVVHDSVRVADLRKTVHQKTLKPQFVHAAFQFTRGEFGILHRQGGEPAKSLRMTTDLFGKHVVGAARHVVGTASIWNRLHGRRI